MKPQTRVVINHAEVRALLTSEEMFEDVEEVAEALISKAGNKQRYTMNRSDTNKARAVVNIGDNSRDAIAWEARTGTLKRLSRRKVE